VGTVVHQECRSLPEGPSGLQVSRKLSVHAGHYAATDGLRRYAACFVCMEMVSALLDL